MRNSTSPDGSGFPMQPHSHSDTVSAKGVNYIAGKYLAVFEFLEERPQNEVFFL